MKCDFCHERDSISTITISESGRMKTINMCEQCARERGFPIKLPISLGKFLSSLIDTNSSKVCPVCGQSLLELQKNRRAGCPECYITFKDSIETMLKNEGINGAYTGDMPNKILHFKSTITDRMILQKKLEQAIEIEDYEKAAVYRDRLKIMETNGIDELADPDILIEGGSNE